MKPTTAVIFTAGFGSRMLPVTAAVQKELLPILDRPVIDYVVADCVAAGITRIVFVIRPGSHGLQDYYLGNPELEAHLKSHHKHAALERLKQVHHQAQFEFVDQTAELGYGTAATMMAAIPHLPKNEPFVVCGGDDFLWRTDGSSEIAALINTFTTTRATGALMAIERPVTELHRYGVLKLRQEGSAAYLTDIVEKPADGEVPSNLINISKYILTPTLLGYVQRVKPDPKSGEFLITDAIQAAAHGHAIVVHHATGEFLDAGNVSSWLHANLTVARTLGND
jgi:UTP--glucose-1-phosphate uridylyltransferase